MATGGYNSYGKMAKFGTDLKCMYSSVEPDHTTHDLCMYYAPHTTAVEQ